MIKIITVLGLMAMLHNMSPAFAAPTLLELRVICESTEVKVHRERSKGWKNKPASAWYASGKVQDGVSGFRYAGPGYKATIDILGVKSEVGDGQTFRVLTPGNKPTDQVLIAKKIDDGIRFVDVDMGDEGAISIALGPIVDESKDFTIKVQPIGWKGIGKTWNGSSFESNYNYRKDNESVLPEMYALCSS